MKDCLDKLNGDIKLISPGEEIEISDVKIQAVPAYNVNKFRSPGVPFHPKEKRYVGFIVTIDGQKIYHAGDTDVIPEMENYDTDVALLPVSGTYVMTGDEAVEAADMIRPKVVIPMHVGRGIGAENAADDFKSKCNFPVEILEFEG